ncbi:ABC transporter substrate-binding protein [Actinospica sp.]|jgi:raffinose/stachyose/melibiose transport system substrate-binding protein|uniref:ABC transporter substrate-binding protein n=1 Tax=Actinospica sp. TaxID=1872142 RepID=UPI002CC09869|nr:extracellular solute-binding protein [Actinospica sp.]HWG22761.1 extracellular solute-binding protein [Actinospica sp.]
MARNTRPSRLVAAVTAGVTIAAGLTACSSGSSNPADTLVIAEWTNPAAVAQTQAVDALFEKQHPGVHIQLEDAPTAANAWPTLQASLLASKNVDVLAQFAQNPADYPPASVNKKPSGTAALIANGQFMDLSKQSFMSRFDTTTQQYTMGYKNGIYGVTVAEYVNNTGLFYKKDILAKYGLSVPTTFTEFINDLKTLKSHGVTPIYVAGKDGYQNIIWAGIVNQLLMENKPAAEAASVYLQRAEDFLNGSQNWNSPLYQEAAQRYEQVMSYIEPGAGGASAQSAPGEWAVQSDNYAFFVDGSYDGNTIAQDNSKLNFGFFAIPGTDTASWNRAALAPDLSWTVPTFSKHQTLALQWIDLFTQQTQYAAWIKATGSISTEPSVPTPTLSWTDWLATNASTGYVNSSQPWIPDGASKEAGGPVLTAMQPFGSQSPSDALSQAAGAYKSTVGH